MYIAVVDDEKVIREDICELIEKQRPESSVEAFSTGEELLASEGRFDIVFLDIQMDGMNGIEAARSLRKRQEETVLIFITGIKEYVFDALDLYAFQYLLKPLNEKKFVEVLDRAVKEAGRKKEKRGLFIKARNLTLDQTDILYIESRGKKVEIHTARDKESIEIYASMEELEGHLGEGFYRCHRAYIVNMAHITEYGSDSILLTNGDKVYLAKKKYGEFVKAYMWHLQNGGVFPVFETANILFSMCLYLFQGYCLQYFYGSFLESRIKDRRWNGLAVVVSYAVFRLVLFWIVPSKNWDYRAEAGKMVLALCMLSVMAVCFYKAFHLITVFLVVVFQAVADISRYAAVILLGELGDGLLGLWNWCAGNGLLVTEKSFGIAINAGLIGQWIIEYLVIAQVLYLSLKKIVWDFREKNYGINRVELLFILTPAAVGLMICMLLRIIIVTMEDGTAKLLYDRYPILIFVLPAILLLSLLSILHGVKLFQDMVYWNREKSNRIVLEKQVGSLQEHMEEMERINSGIRSMKHDMKNTISVIQRLAARDGEEENVELQAYLSELNRTFEKLDIRFKTGNTVVDTLLNMKYHEAVREVPDLKMDADKLLLPQELDIRSYDIGVILGNALDNAIEACGKLKKQEQAADTFIGLSSLQKGNLLILKVENSFDGRLARRRREELPMTNKADKKSHGIGLANIKSTAEKYGGTMDFKVKGRVFILSVMMKNERRSEDEFWSDR